MKTSTIPNYQYIVINGSTDRKLLMEKQFSFLNTEAHIHYLEASTPSNSQDYFKGYTTVTNHKFICCTRSHIRALEYASKSSCEYSIIVEDDVAFYKDNFEGVVDEIIDNWSTYSPHKMVSIGWVPTNNYSEYGNGKYSFNADMSTDNVKMISGFYMPGTQGYIVKNNDIPYLEQIIQPTYMELNRAMMQNNRYTTLLKNDNTMNNRVADVFITRMLTHVCVFPPLLIEQDIPSMLGHSNETQYWSEFFKNHEEKKDNYFSTNITTMDKFDILVEKEKRSNIEQYSEFNNSTKIKFLFLRCQAESSWITDTTKLWGPDIEAEYILDVLTNDGVEEKSIQFLSVPYDYDFKVIKGADIIAYSSNIYDVTYISNLVDMLKPSTLFHLSDEHGCRPEFKTVFKKVDLVYRQYKFENLPQFQEEIEMKSVKYLPLGYHSWGKKYNRRQSSGDNRRYKWCFSGSIKNERETQIKHLQDISPHFCQNTHPFETSIMFKNSTFAFCPPGNTNIECSRIYEAMYNGCIPIILSSNHKRLTSFINMFEVPLPCYTANTIEEVYSIVNTTSTSEIKLCQAACYLWVNSISKIIRTNVVEGITSRTKETTSVLDTKRLELEGKRNVFIYWVGPVYPLISILRNLMYLHSTSGKGYTINLITDKNVHTFIKDIPSYFSSMLPAHQADFVRVNVVCDYGGIWLDSDTLVIDSLDSLFDILDERNGFFIKENNRYLLNGIFGSKPATLLMNEWKRAMNIKLKDSNGKIGWTAIGNSILEKIYSSSSSGLYNNFIIFNGLDNLYPVNWDNCVEEFITKPYDNYKTIVRDYQPLVVLVNSVYKVLKNKTPGEILKGAMPLNYFINKSFQNMKLVDLDFIEIGTSNFDTLIEKADENTRGISVDAVKYYIDCLPDKLNVKKINVAISNIDDTIDVYYIPESVIIENNLPDWFKGCNCINNYHPLHLHHKVKHLCNIDKVKVITASRLWYENKVRKTKFLKIDTEGHDCIILSSLFVYIKNLPDIFYPDKIVFETNTNSLDKDVDEILQLYISIGYKLVSRGYDTEIMYNRN